MALPVMTWRASDIYTVSGTSTVKEWVTALRDAVNAENVTYSGLTYFSVSDYDAAEAHVELSSNGANVTNMRLLFFGGSSPNAGALNGMSANATYLYSLCSDGAGGAGPDQSYTVGNPYATRDATNTLGVVFGLYNSAYDRIRYWECEDGIVIQIYQAASNSTFVSCCGAIIQKWDADTRIYSAIGTGTSPVTNTDWWSTLSAASIIPVESAPSTTDPTCSYIDPDDSSSANKARRTTSASDTEAYKNVPGNIYLFEPVFMLSNDTTAGVGSLRQMAIGPQETTGKVVTVSSAPKAYAVSASASVAYDTLWLLNQ